MGRASQALQQTLSAYEISQSALAAGLGVDRPVVYRWFHGKTDPTGETIADIVRALRAIEPEAAKDFVNSYLGEVAQLDVASASSVTGDRPQSLPTSERVNVSALAQLFDKTTNSYKYLFFLSLLDILKRRQFDVLSPISFTELVVEMLANAWYPHTYSRLSFGRQDKIAEKLDSLELEIAEPILKFTDTDKRQLRKTIQAQEIGDIVSFISKYVPFRLIRPFFQQETQGLKDFQVNPAIVESSFLGFELQRPLYRFNSEDFRQCNAIEVNPAWADYIANNFAIVRDWAAWAWLNYMQSRNPSTPNVVSKIFMPQNRGSLSGPTQFWRKVISNTEISCIYSGSTLAPDRIAIDHFLPWSFVAHDLTWNLIPTIPEVNSSKSNNLPSLRYLKDFAAMQHAGINFSRSIMSSRTWEKYLEPYVLDLNLTIEELLDLETLSTAYEGHVKPLLNLAASQGFSKDWIFRQ